MKTPAQRFKIEDVQKMEEELIYLKSRYARLLSMAMQVVDLLKEVKAKEYMLHGVCRRLTIIERCIENIYSIFPFARGTFLSQDELHDIAIYLHSFFVNIFGFLDNLAWVLVYENGNVKINKFDVNLFNPEIKELAPSNFRDYLSVGHIKEWHDAYLKEYRDTLAHRIPPYLPRESITPEQQQKLQSLQNELNKQSRRDSNFERVKKLQEEIDCVGEPCIAFRHAVEESRVVFLHPQIITDFKTIEEILEKFCTSFGINDD
ncbi:MAG: hypothetical protein AB7S78_12435 [Candidatus Omnitrophota bacterium]